MQKKTSMIVFSLVFILLIGSVSAFSFSDWFKQSFFGAITGNVIESGTCGEYSLGIPTNAVASDTASDSSANNAFDDDTATQWVGDNSSVYPKWIYFDLGSTKCINSLDSYLDSSAAPTTFDLQVSDDLETWITLSPGISLSEGDKYSTTAIDETTARYVRIYQTTGPEGVFGSLSEIKINSADYTAEIEEATSGETVPSVAQCSDDEPEANPETSGTIQVVSKEVLSLDDEITSFADACSSVNTLTEYSCEDGSKKTTIIHCPSGCNAETGTCNSLSTTEEQVEEEQVEETKKIGTPQCGSYSLNTPFDAVASSQFTSYVASNAIDGDINTHWYGDPKRSYPKSIYFDLGGEKCLNSVDLNVFIWDAPITAELQISSDARNWISLTDPFEISEGGSYTHKSFPEVVTRYVRVYETQGRRNYGALSEIRVNTAEFDDNAEVEVLLQVKNTVGEDTPDKFYEISGRRVYIEIDGKPVEDYFS